MTNQAMKVVVPSRELTQQYEGFVYANWLHSFRKYNPQLKKAESKPYFDQYRKFISSLLKKPDSLVNLLLLEEDKDIVLGFSVSREDVLDYLFVPFHLRGNKMTSMLIPEGITTFTHTTTKWEPIWLAKYKDWKFNPYA